jgi:23S rRNA (adenine2503-C2)-methyltransferase
VKQQARRFVKQQAYIIKGYRTMQENGVHKESGAGWDIKSMTLDELTALMKENGFPAFRAKQLYRWMHVSLVREYSEMRNIPKAMAEQLSSEYPLTAVRMIDRQVSKLDGTQKYLFAMADNSLVESVFMRYKFGNSVCISSQVGCRMGCRFCASTLDGLIRSLTPSEMLDQIYEIQRVTGERVSHIVVMGTGEPLDNYDNLVRFLRLLTDENGLNISQRNVTVSTCGIVPRIYDLADEKFSITLALSLHAVTDEKRKEIMPIANHYTIAELMEAGRYYFDQTGRQVTFEYSLIRDVNDSAQDAQMLAELARPLKAHINLIPVNPVKERGYRQTKDAGVRAFQKKLEKSGINVSIRRVLGRDIDGACGQLRHRHISGCNEQNASSRTEE